MADSVLTRPSLLLRLRDGRDAAAWAEFVDLYAPLVYGFARKHGLQDADAADVTQDVLQALVGAIGRLDYDPRRGTFRGWLFTVVRHKLQHFLDRRRRHKPGSGDSGVQNLLELQPAPEQLPQWERDYQQRLWDWAAEQVRRTCSETTWQAFWLTAVAELSSKEAARRLGVSVAAVYLAKRRVLTRLQSLIQEIDNE
jgi:RNA polymerase sigma factor (sigma-70 family)